jgi:hypothetical protein
MVNMRVIGIDCATKNERIGLACGLVTGAQLRLQHVVTCQRDRLAAEQVISWIANGSEPVLLAVDSPLGWPQTLASSLAMHKAGVEISVEADQLFMRETDRFVLQLLGKRPLSVGADRIARTALATLRLIGEIRQGIDSEIPLAWSHRRLMQTSVIEVYPAATLTAWGWPADGYKKHGQHEQRQRIIQALRRGAFIDAGAERMETSADALDAAICVFAGADFLLGRSVEPRDRTRAEREGWIWVRDRRAPCA